MPDPSNDPESISWTEAEPLRDFVERAGTRALTPEERRLIIDQAVNVLDSFYVHLPQKRAVHGANPVQRLKEVRRNLSHTRTDQDFFGELCDSFVILRDLHTAFALPTLYQEHTAVLPFQVEACAEEGAEDGAYRYIVTRVTPGFEPQVTPGSAPFVPGVEVLEWSGVPIRRAVQIAALRSAGTSPEARHGRGVQFLTTRPMQRQPPPDEAWVELFYRADDGTPGVLRCEWRVIPVPGGAGATAARPDAAAGLGLGLDQESYTLGRARVQVHAPRVIAAERRRARGQPSARSGGDEIATPLPGKFEARRVHDGRFGYVRLHSFTTDAPQEYLEAFAGVLAELPRQGLILDLRGNGGGSISLAESLLQLLTWRRIQPAPAQLIATPEVLKLCEAVEALEPWAASVRYALETGAGYSDPRPMTPPEDCNEIGQRYHGPVVLVTDALCYSATDIFAAGFQDHDIGPILGCDATTGAGGANVILHDLLRERLGDDGASLQALPHGCGLRFAIRRTLRVGGKAGAVLEEAGVRPDLPLHRITRADLLGRNRDLIARAAGELARRPWHALDASIEGGELAVKTRGIGRVDVYLDDRPLPSLAEADPRGHSKLAAGLPQDAWAVLELKGFTDGKQVAARRLRSAPGLGG